MKGNRVKGRQWLNGWNVQQHAVPWLNMVDYV
jgi:hypothetical protein